MQTAISSVLIDMYVKIESERLQYIKFNKKLRSERYIHLRDAIIGNVDSTILYIFFHHSLLVRVIFKNVFKTP